MHAHYGRHGMARHGTRSMHSMQASTRARRDGGVGVLGGSWEARAGAGAMREGSTGNC
jgi:hypothetical protein